MAIGNLLTMTEAAKQIGVSRQRMHELVIAYGLKVTEVNVGNIRKMIDKQELKKLPKNRPSGIHIGK